VKRPKVDPMVWVWGALACTGGPQPVDTSPSFEPRVVLADGGIVLGGDGAAGTLDGWRIDGSSVHRLTPTGAGSFVAGAPRGDGVVAVAAHTNGSAPQLWTWDGAEWAVGPTIAHGPIHQIIVASDGSFWTEGDRGVHRSIDGGAGWVPMAVGANLRLGSVKLGHAEGRVVFAGAQLVATYDEGRSWKVLYDGMVSATDGTWVAESTPRPSLRVGRITDDGLMWTGEVDGQWTAAAIRGHAGGVRMVATKTLSTDVVVFEANVDGSVFERTRVDGPAAWVGLGERLVWVDKRKRIHVSP